MVLERENRTGIDTISTFGYYYEIDLREGFPLLTTKKISWKNIVVELLWFLSGSNQSEFLERHNCTFWRSWYNNDGTVNSAYNQAWRQFKFPDCNDGGDIFIGSNDQVAWVLNKLKNNPMSRDLVVSAWQPNIAQNPPSPNAYLAPCHSMWILNVQNEENGASEPNKRLCLHLTQRSADVCIGIPFNIASYSLLCSLIARFANIEPGIFAHTLIDAHIYTSKADGSQSEYDHIPGAKEQLTRNPKRLLS